MSGASEANLTDRQSTCLTKILFSGSIPQTRRIYLGAEHDHQDRCVVGLRLTMVLYSILQFEGIDQIARCTDQLALV
jgi:hypothetical protein